MPVGDVLVGDTRGDVEHDDTALSVDVVSVAKTAKLLLSRSVPHIKLDLTQVLRQRQLPSTCKRVLVSERTVVKPRGWTSTPRVAMYFFSNSPVK